MLILLLNLGKRGKGMEIEEKLKLRKCKLCETTKGNLFYWVNTDTKDLEGKWICLCHKCNMEAMK